MRNPAQTRRDFLSLSAILLLCLSTTADASPPTSAYRPAWALSLGTVQEFAASPGQANRKRAEALDGLTRVTGVLLTDTDIILLGEKDRSWEADLATLAVVLRNRFRGESEHAYQGILGCTIDPVRRPDVEDPWRIQEAKVFGMPTPSVGLGYRFVTIDYELKRLSASLSRIPNVKGTFEMSREALVDCSSSGDASESDEVTHRFWFAPYYASRDRGEGSKDPRFAKDDGVVWIKRPIEVQLMTEREFFDSSGQRSGSAPASEEAARFAEMITSELLAHSRRDYRRLTNDFRIIELGELLRYLRVSPSLLTHLLYEYQVPTVEVPSYVGGVRREEAGEIVCKSEVKEESVDGGSVIHSQEQVRPYRLGYRGGVMAKVEIKPDDFSKERRGRFADLRNRVLRSRPNEGVIAWQVRY